MSQQSGIRLRFDPDDEALSRLHALAFGTDHRGVTPWRERLQRHSLTWAGAFDGDELVGFVHVVWDGGLHAFLLDTVVHPDHQRKDLGRSLVEAVAAEARATGCEWLHVDHEPHLASFYAACGFSPTAAGLRRLVAEG